MQANEVEFNELEPILGCSVCASAISGFVPSVITLRCELHPETDMQTVLRTAGVPEPNKWELNLSRKQNRG